MRNCDRFLGELYTFKVTSSQVIFDTLYLLITYGLNSNDMDGTLREIANRTYLGSLNNRALNDEETPFYRGNTSWMDTFRMQCVCLLLETCGKYLRKGRHKSRCDRFLLYFQRFVISKQPIPMLTEWTIDEVLAYVAPDKQRVRTIAQVQHAIEELEKEEMETEKSYIFCLKYTLIQFFLFYKKQKKNAIIKKMNIEHRDALQKVSAKGKSGETEEENENNNKKRKESQGSDNDNDNENENENMDENDDDNDNDNDEEYDDDEDDDEYETGYGRKHVYTKEDINFIKELESMMSETSSVPTTAAVTNVSASVSGGGGGGGGGGTGDTSGNKAIQNKSNKKQPLAIKHAQIMANSLKNMNVETQNAGFTDIFMCVCVCVCVCVLLLECEGSEDKKWCLENNIKVSFLFVFVCFYCLFVCEMNA